MSESIQENWPSPEAGFEAQHIAMLSGIEAIHDNLIVPEDQRFELAYALLLAGRGQKSSVLALGDPATGKTSFGDLLFGGHNRVEISRDDVEDTLYGYYNPINRNESIPGKLVGLTPENPTAYLNEISHMANTGEVHRLWDLSEIEIDGQKVSLRDIAMYLTSNFPDGTPRVHELDEALRSRITAEILTGDHDEATAIQIQGFNAVKDKDDPRAPILPRAYNRRSIHDLVADRYPVQSRSTAVGRFTVELLQNLNKSGLVRPVSTGDARVGEALHDVSRAKLFLNKAEQGTNVEPRHIAEVAALVLPTIVSLSHDARHNLMNEAGRRPQPMEQAIAVRRLIARTAFQTLFDNIPMAPSQRSQEVDKGMEKYSYANLEAVTLDIDKALFAGNVTTAKPMEKKPDERRRSWLRSR